jgi:phosphoglucomutase
MGKDTHALSGPAQRTALEVLAANEIEAFIAEGHGHADAGDFLVDPDDYNRGQDGHLADGIVITPSHNPPADGGFKYNPPNGGPADTDVTNWIQDRANALLREKWQSRVKRKPFELALQGATTHALRFHSPYVADLVNGRRSGAIRSRREDRRRSARRGILDYWEPIASLRPRSDRREPQLDPTFGFMPVDHDGKIRMDCSSPYAMANLVKLKDDYRVAFGNDPDSDRHGIVTPSAGLMNPNHYLAVAINIC